MSDAARVVSVRNLTRVRRGVPDSRGRYVYLLPGETSKPTEFRESTLRRHQKLGILDVIGIDDARPATTPNDQAMPNDIDGKEALAAHAKALGIAVDGRWSESRLRREIAKAETAGQS